MALTNIRPWVGELPEISMRLGANGLPVARTPKAGDDADGTWFCWQYADGSVERATLVTRSAAGVAAAAAAAVALEAERSEREAITDARVRVIARGDAHLALAANNTLALHMRVAHQTLAWLCYREAGAFAKLKAALAAPDPT